MSQLKVKFEGREWDVIKDCGTFYVAQIADEVRNIPKDVKVKKETSEPSHN